MLCVSDNSSLSTQLLKEATLIYRGQTLGRKVDKRAFQVKLKSLESLMEEENKALLAFIASVNYLLNKLDKIFLVSSYLSLCLLFMSSVYHLFVHNRWHALSVSQEYFYYIFSHFVNITHTPYKATYASYRYYIDGPVSKPEVTMVIHELMQMVIFFDMNIIEMDIFKKKASNEIFCNLNNFSLLLERSPIKALPDSYYSSIVIAISTFFWLAYTFILLSKFIFKSWALHIESFNAHLQKQDIIPLISEYIKGEVDGKFLEKMTKSLVKEDCCLLTKYKESLRKVLNKSQTDLYTPLKSMLRPICLIPLVLVGSLSFFIQAYHIHLVPCAEFLKIMLICIFRMLNEAAGPIPYPVS